MDTFWLVIGGSVQWWMVVGGGMVQPNTFHFSRIRQEPTTMHPKETY